MKDSLVMYR